MRAAGTNAAGVIEALATGVGPFRRLKDDARNLGFWLAEVDAYRPGSATISYDYGLGTRAAGTLALVADQFEDNAKFCASDRGYYSKLDDVGGQVAYPPLLETAFEANRRINLSPTDHAAGASWGTLRLSNPNGQWDSVAAEHINDGRAVRILFGVKNYDADRGLHVDPSYADLTAVFRGMQLPWFLGEQTLDIPLRDASYWLERPIQGSVYSGAGGANGTDDLAGKPVPMARGGTSGNPIRNVAPVLIDPTNRIYQYTDYAGTVVNLYERGAEVFNFSADYADYTALAAATVNSGDYATADAVGMFRLGADPVGEITADITGAFSSGAQTQIGTIARYLLSETVGLDPEFVDDAAFTGLDAAFPYVAGVWIGLEPRAAVDVLGEVLGSIGARLTASRAGRLRPYALRAIPDGTRPAATLTTAEIVNLRPVAMPADIAPPPYRFRVGYQRNHTPQVTDLATSVSNSRRQFLRDEYRFGTWLDGAILTSYRRPNDPQPVTGCLLVKADATAVAEALGALWGMRRRLYEVECWLDPLEREIGDVVVLQYPVDDLASGQLGIVVGEQVRSGASTVTLSILV